ncbi:MAG TPA: superoxide dismutase [Candidatus Aphodoplasma excrementigallinarum]|uniref:Superoxide dismutase n=1 Tax=Candidatus Aphodoplasma excrementigallinarum TaxID=2840673 RepID=A0A9D1NHX9_9FIRM|nr:superoxide dismutase [Candidatus Aphodoplasma excrementigallinarum]
MNMERAHYEFTLPPLCYDFDALEPYIDTETVYLHHNKHFQTYTDNLNAVLKKYPRLWRYSIEELLTRPKLLPKDDQTKLINNAGGYYNHDFYFRNLRAGKPGNRPSGALAAAIEATFGGFEPFKDEFTKQALAVFGSGYLWLVKSGGRLGLLPTKNQDAPITYGYTPIACIDVWEHAYYLKYHNRRVEYIQNWFYIVNWAMSERMYAES